MTSIRFFADLMFANFLTSIENSGEPNTPESRALISSRIHIIPHAEDNCNSFLIFFYIFLCSRYASLLLLTLALHSIKSFLNRSNECGTVGVVDHVSGS